MNLYNYWLKIKALYPIATADCVAHFQQSHREDWKSHFKDPDQIVAWLERRRISIITRKKQERQIRFEMKAYEETTVTAFLFHDRESALYDAIERAFRILEQRALRQRAESVRPDLRRRRPSPTLTDRGTIGERAQALREQEKAEGKK